MTAPLDAVFFDFDGTLVDTEGADYTAWQQVFSSHGAELSTELFATGIGHLDAIDPADILERMIGRPLDRAAVRRRHAELHVETLSGVSLREGMEEFIEDVRSRGIPTAIVSSSESRWVRHHLESLGIDADWPVVVAADGDVARSKPNPVLYLEALSLLRGRPERCLAIEDSPPGIAAATAAGIKCVAFPHALTCELDLSAADHVVGDLADFTLNALVQAAWSPTGAQTSDVAS